MASAGFFQYPLFGSSVCNISVEAQSRTGRESFSILCSDRVSATEINDKAIYTNFNFQYPLFGSSVCNPPDSDHRMRYRWGFQYPLFGSSVCNIPSHRRSPWVTFLSVSSVRIECLQPYYRSVGLLEGVGLSVSSVRIECLQPSSKRNGSLGLMSLSVSSVRIECLQPPLPASAKCGICGFQYPLFGSSVCNGRGREESEASSPLSVSSVRIECLQQLPHCSPEALPVAFQYPLFGSSVCNPFHLQNLLLANLPFSILCSDRVSATASVFDAASGAALLSVSSVRIECLQHQCRGAKQDWPGVFQYPLFGSSVCNNSCRSFSRSCRRPFSILCSDRVSAT